MRIETEDNSLEIGVKRHIFNSSLRKMRIKKGISQKELCEKTGMSMAKIQPIEQLKRIPTHDEADAIADALGTTIDQILPPDIYEKVVPKIKELPNEVFFEVTPMSLSFNEIRQLKSTEGDIEKIGEEMNMQMIVKRYIDRLQDREKRILTLRFGLEDGVSRPLEDVGREFGSTRERIRQIEAKALNKLRKWMAEDHLTPDKIF